MKTSKPLIGLRQLTTVLSRQTASGDGNQIQANSYLAGAIPGIGRD